MIQAKGNWGSTKVRLDRFISNHSEYTRTQIHRLIKSRSVRVNDALAKSPSIKVNAESDLITVDQQVIRDRGNVYLMLNKPVGYVSATVDAEHPTIIDLITDNRNAFTPATFEALPPIANLQVVGRLDIDTTGLILITNDGQWNHKVSAPNTKCQKRYRAELAQTIADDAQLRFAEGMQLKGENKNTQAAELKIITPSTVEVAICEGKYHQVKRMFAATGNKVVALHRLAIGQLKLDDTLAAGQYRLLDEHEKNLTLKATQYE